MFLRELELQNFRCFEDKKIIFSKQITFITGVNGIGKTTLLEAIHYLCYFKSFRAHMITDVIKNESDSFFLRGSFDRTYDFEQASHMIQVGYSGHKKSIKLDQKAVTSYKQIMSFFQVITLTEDDIDLIKGYPNARRSFIDQAVLLINNAAFDDYTQFRKILAHRNSLLSAGKNIDLSELEVWNYSLWKATIKIQESRLDAIKTIKKVVNELLNTYFEGIYEVDLVYEAKNIIISQNYEEFSLKMGNLVDQERFLKRSLYGAHLDDISIHIKGKKARVYASRGQQKLVSLLCKLSLATFKGSYGDYPILLIDDFISDFDKIRLQQLVYFFKKCSNQIIITAPFCDSELEKLFEYSDLELVLI